MGQLRYRSIAPSSKPEWLLKLQMSISQCYSIRGIEDTPEEWKLLKDFADRFISNNQMILISPPMFIGEGYQRESISSSAHRCSYCHGNGFFWELDRYGESEKTPCPICQSRGIVDAVVTIEWKMSDV